VEKGLRFDYSVMEPTLKDAIPAIETTWVVVAAVLVMFMQVGFLFLEVGFSRMKNAGTVVPKILANFSIAALCYWAVGFAIAFGGAGWFAGTHGTFLGTTTRTCSPRWRSRRRGSSEVLLPVRLLRGLAGDRLGHDDRAHQVRRVPDLRGRLQRADLPDHQPLDLRRRLAQANLGMQDFAGSTVVHLTGATGALAALLLLGPRPRQVRHDGKPNVIPGHNMPLVGLAVLVLWFGWFGFNAGSTLGAIGGRFADVVVVTQLGAAAACSARCS
jgi:Amt family ammonium transporter